jgi:hypothetical protein
MAEEGSVDLAEVIPDSEDEDYAPPVEILKQDVALDASEHFSDRFSGFASHHRIFYAKTKHYHHR